MQVVAKFSGFMEKMKPQLALALENETGRPPGVVAVTVPVPSTSTFGAVPNAMACGPRAIAMVCVAGVAAA